MRSRAPGHRALVLLIVAGCVDPSDTVRIGYKDFAEQAILAEILSQRIESELSLNTERVLCGDTFGCQQAMRNDSIDLMVEYTGTGLVYSGSSADHSEKSSLADLRELYAPLGIRWLGPLGFDNSYEVVIPSSRATSLEASSIEDLGKDGDGIRLAIPTSYLRRPRDGYRALLERHGIRERTEPLIDDSSNRVRSVLDGSADAAVVYTTDGMLRGLDLTFLDDSLNFFPPYEAAVIVREDFSAAHQDVVDAVTALEGRIDTRTMRDLNYKVEVSGWKPASVARQFLTKAQLTTATSPPAGQAATLILAAPAADEFDGEIELAVRTIRSAFPKRRVITRRVRDPRRVVATGGARLAVVGAEHFFRSRRGTVERIDGLEAAAVVSTRYIHVLRRTNDPGGPLDGRIGLTGSTSGSALTGTAILDAAGFEAHSHGGFARQLSKLASSQLDALIVLAAPGRGDIADAVGTDLVKIVALTDPTLRGKVPHLRPARIPRNTYKNQGAPIETLSAQVVLAGPSRRARHHLNGGPAAALTPAADPLSAIEAEALATASPVQEAPDPALASVWSATIAEPETAVQARLHSVIDTALNLLVLCFLGWLVVLTVRPVKPSQ